MNSLFKKITKDVILPLVIAGEIYNTGFSQTITDSLAKYNQENKKVYENFVNFIKEYGKKDNKEISYLKIIKETKEDKIFFASLNSDENPEIIQLGFFKLRYGRKFLDNYPWGMEGNDMYRNSNLGKLDGEFDANNQTEMIKNLLKKEQLKAGQEYTEILKEMMHNEKFGGY